MDQALIISIVSIALLAISEILDAIPSVRANSIWKAIRNIIYAVLKKPLPEDQEKK